MTRFKEYDSEVLADEELPYHLIVWNDEEPLSTG